MLGATFKACLQTALVIAVAWTVIGWLVSFAVAWRFWGRK